MTKISGAHPRRILSSILQKRALSPPAAYRGGGGLGGGLDPPQNPKYPTQTLARLGASAKFWQKHVFLRPFWAIFRPASGIFWKVALPRFLELPTFAPAVLPGAPADLGACPGNQLRRGGRQGLLAGLEFARFGRTAAPVHSGDVAGAITKFVKCSKQIIRTQKFNMTHKS